MAESFVRKRAEMITLYENRVNTRRMQLLHTFSLEYILRMCIMWYKRKTGRIIVLTKLVTLKNSILGFPNATYNFEEQNRSVSKKRM